MESRGIVRLNEIDFAGFTAALITQTLDAIISAQLEQEKKIRQFEKSVALPLDEFAEEAVPLYEAEEELAQRFPVSEYPEGIKAGTPYAPSSGGQSEEPPIRERTGYLMKDNDRVKQGNATVISETGYVNIVKFIRQALAVERQAEERALFSRGLPRVIVDHGRINAKLFFNFTSSSTGTASSPVKTALPRLSVRSVDLRRPEVARLSVNVVGEVDITFKTVSE